jgi:hypothetical protein
MSPGWVGCHPSISRVSPLEAGLSAVGVTRPAARLTAEAGIAVFKVVFERWVYEPGQPNLPQLIRQSLDELKTVTAGR